jgi:hypothetical protein
MGRPGAFGPIVSLFEKLIVTQKIDVPVKKRLSQIQFCLGAQLAGSKCKQLARSLTHWLLCALM